jgi:hypothetical protein
VVPVYFATAPSLVRSVLQTFESDRRMLILGLCRLPNESPASPPRSVSIVNTLRDLQVEPNSCCADDRSQQSFSRQELFLLANASVRNAKSLLQHPPNDVQEARFFSMFYTDVQIPFTPGCFVGRLKTAFIGISTTQAKIWIVQ